MKYGHIEGIDKDISRLVQGTSTTTFTDTEQSFLLLDQVFELGGNTFDTAQEYGDGMAERILGQWMSERRVREQVIIISKGAHHNEDRKRVTPFDISSDLFDSLARLKTDYIDLYLLHRDDPAMPVGPIVEILNEHQKAGRIKAFGGSNWSIERIEAANAYARKNGLLPFSISSPNFSLAEQVKEPWEDCVTISGQKGKAGRAWYQKNQMPLFTWSSLAGGFFSGRFTRDNLASFTEYYAQVSIEAYCYEENFERLDRVKELATEKGLSVAQVALAYVLNYPLNIFALVGCNTPAEFRANHQASTVSLTTAEMAWLDLKSESR